MAGIDGYILERRRVVMEADPDDPKEAWGVLNPASARGRDGELYLFPRLVATGNYSRIRRARVTYDSEGEPSGVERLGVVLEPEEAWERNTAGGGVEDARITFVPSLDTYVMAYSAYGPLGPRIGLAVSADLTTWERLGPAWFAYEARHSTDLNLFSNKDAVLLPEPVPDPSGRPSYAMLHRPTWDLSWFAPAGGEEPPAAVTDARPGIWVSYAPAEEVQADQRRLPRFDGHREVAVPQHPWEAVKIGGGTPPVRTAEGWLAVYHGVSGRVLQGTDHQPHVRYSAGLMLLRDDDVSHVIARSTTPLMEPELEGEREGIVPNVVFPTAIEPRDDGDYDVFYGMADSRIGLARLRRPR